jgi:hypothetical protein
MSPYEKVDAERAAALENVALRVIEVLQGAGFSASSSRSPGAVVQVDLGNDTAGGVYVTWRAAGAVEARVIDCVMSGQTNDPAIEELAELRLIMQKALLAILSARGFVVANSNDDLRANSVVVTGAPPRESTGSAEHD